MKLLMIVVAAEVLLGSLMLAHGQDPSDSFTDDEKHKIAGCLSSEAEAQKARGQAEFDDYEAVLNCGKKLEMDLRPTSYMTRQSNDGGEASGDTPTIGARNGSRRKQFVVPAKVFFLFDAIIDAKRVFENNPNE